MDDPIRLTPHPSSVDADQRRFVLDNKQWKAFIAALDRPAKSKPRLRRLFAEPSILEKKRR